MQGAPLSGRAGPARRSYRGPKGMGAMATTTKRSRRVMTDDEIRQHREERQAKLEALHARFTEQVAELVEGDQWRAMLRVAARFHRYSFGNVLLIMAQREDATQVAGYRTWQSLGRQVRRGERGIQILAPVTYRGGHDDETEQRGDDEPNRPRQLRGFKVEHVWDIAQTDGDPVPDVRPVLLEGEGSTGLWDLIATQVAAAGYHVARGTCTNPQANGETDPVSRSVTVREDLSAAQAAKTLVHELAHIRLGHVESVPSYQACRGRCEVEAESVAYLVCTEAGVDAGEYSLPYVARWADGDVAVIRESADRVLTAARSITETMLPAADVA